MRLNAKHYTGMICLLILLLINPLECTAGAKSVLRKNKKLIAQKKYDQALVNLEKAIKKYPAETEMWYYLGLVRLRKSTPEATLEAFNKVLGLGGATLYWDSYHYLGLSHDQLKNHDKAIENYTLCLGLRSGYLPALERRGWAYLNTRQFDLSQKDFDAVLAKDPNYLSALRGKGRAYALENKYDQAVEFFTRLINVTPPGNTFILSESYLKRGESYYILAQFEKARDDFNEMLKLADPDNKAAVKKATVGKAFCLMAMGDMETALALMDQLEKNSSPKEDLNPQRALVYYLAGDKQKSMELRGGSGMIGLELDPSRNGQKGIYVESVVENGPAFKAGLFKGDIITALDGRAILNAVDFSKQIKKINPGTVVQVGILREGFEKQIPVEMGSDERLLENHPLCRPILAARIAPEPAEKSPGTTIYTSAKDDNELDVSGAGEQDTPIPVYQETGTAGIAIESVRIEPSPVQAGQRFEIIINFVVNAPDTSGSHLSVTMDYSILQKKKLLKRFKSKEFRISNEKYQTLTRNPKASKTKGSYTLLVELGYKEKKTSKTVTFNIE